MRVLVTGQVEYRTSNAARFRVEAVVEVMRQLGHQVDIFEGHTFNKRVPSGPVGAVRYHVARPPQDLFRWWRAKVGVGYRLLDSAILREHFDIVYCYGSELSWLFASWWVAHKSQARLVVDVVEFYGFEDMTQSFSAFRSRIGSWLGILPCIPLLAHAIAVPSRRFLDLFHWFHRRVHLLPPFFCDLAPLSQIQSDDRTLKLVYAGNPGNKERLPMLFQALEMLDVPEGKRIVLRLVGIDQQSVKSIADAAGVARLLLRQDISIEAVGRVDVKRAREEISSADFSIAVRHRSRRVNFGFPSKVSESLCLGTPLICNVYSDIADYLEHGHNSILLQEDRPELLRDILLYCLAMSRGDRNFMRKKAAATGRAYFSANAVREVVERILSVETLTR